MVEKNSPAETVAETDLVEFCDRAFRRAGVPQADSRIVANSLVEADLRGVGSHGVVRLPIYVQRLRAGANNPRPNIRVLRETVTGAVMDGDNGMGHLVCTRAMGMAVEKGREGRCFFVAVRGSNHNGTQSHFVEMATRADMIGFSFSIGGINHMCAWGGAEGILGNNPFGIGIPAGERRPVILDMACSVAARGKVNVAAARGESIPDGWCTDADGRPTTDPIAALSGFVLPVGGPKGYALTVTSGLISTMLAGAAFGRQVTHLYDDLERPQNIGHLLGVIPVAAFDQVAAFKARMDAAIRDVKECRRAPGVEEIFLPGEREFDTLERRRREGIPLPGGTMAELRALGETLGIPFGAKAG